MTSHTAYIYVIIHVRCHVTNIVLNGTSIQWQKSVKHLSYTRHLSTRHISTSQTSTVTNVHCDNYPLTIETNIHSDNYPLGQISTMTNIHWDKYPMISTETNIHSIGSDQIRSDLVREKSDLVRYA